MTTARSNASRASRIASTSLVVLLTLAIHARSDTAAAERIGNDVAVFAALDKVTARISRLPIPIGQTVTFGALKVTPRACYTRPPTEDPKTTTFVEVDEIGLEGQETRIFSGWMFAESPGLNAVEHAVFDVWLTGCEKPQRGMAQRGGPGIPDDGTTAGGEDGGTLESGRRRIHR